jgi:hypothetical protein
MVLSFVCTECGVASRRGCATGGGGAVRVVPTRGSSRVRPADRVEPRRAGGVPAQPYRTGGGGDRDSPSAGRSRPTAHRAPARPRCRPSGDVAKARVGMNQLSVN